MKKTISHLLAVCVACCCLLSAAAQRDCGPIAVKLNSDIAGLTDRDVAGLIELKTDNVTYKTEAGGPILIADYAGSPETGALVAGRTYTIYYNLSAADGYALPAQLSDGAVSIACGKGVSVISVQITTANIRQEDGTMQESRGLRIFAKVVVDGSALQRLLGMFHDLILKIKAWSLY